MGLLEEIFGKSERDAERRQAETDKKAAQAKAEKEVAIRNATSGTEAEYLKYHNELTQELANAEAKSPHKLDLTTSTGEVISVDSPLVGQLKNWLSVLESSRDKYLNTEETNKKINDILGAASTPKQTLAENLVGIATPAPAGQTNYSSMAVIGIAAYLLLR